jgi:hypothetical protein
MEEEKAKYIEYKERTLENDLNKASKKLHIIANWYSLSSYKSNIIDEKNIKLFMLKINNIFYELKSLLASTHQMELYYLMESLITKERLNDLSELEQKISDVKNNDLWERYDKLQEKCGEEALGRDFRENVGDRYGFALKEGKGDMSLSSLLPEIENAWKQDE